MRAGFGGQADECTWPANHPAAHATDPYSRLAVEAGNAHAFCSDHTGEARAGELSCNAGNPGIARCAGTAHTFFSGQTDKARAGELINVLREAGQPVPPELLAFGTTVKRKESKLYGAHFKEVDFSQKASKVTFDSDSD